MTFTVRSDTERVIPLSTVTRTPMWWGGVAAHQLFVVTNVFGRDMCTACK